VVVFGGGVQRLLDPLGVGRRRLVRRLAAAEDGTGAGVLVHEAQAAAPAREELGGDLLEVARRSLEGLLEGGLDPVIGLADEAAQLAQRRLEVLALRLQVLHVRLRLGVLLLGERVDRAELLAAATRAARSGPPGSRGPRRKRLGRRLGLEAEALGELGQPGLASARASRDRWAATSRA
jgi:hypothetical protein